MLLIHHASISLSVCHITVQVAAAMILEASPIVSEKGGDAVAQEAENGRTASKVFTRAFQANTVDPN